MPFKQSQALFRRAVKVIPNGIYGHTSPAVTLPGASPYYAARAQGCRYWDVDGTAYIDYMCAYGPIVLGYGHPEVNAAVAEQQALGDCFNHPTPHMITLAERLVDWVDFADWAVFAKNGSDVTTWAIQVARQYTGRKKILHVTGGYHGVDAWCTPGHGGLIAEDRMHIHSFHWNNVESFHAAMTTYANEIAAVIITPFHHPAFADCELPDPGFLTMIQQDCNRAGVVLILDDIRAGFRLHLGGSHRYFGFEPDMICFCKAMANGHPISSALGRDSLKVAASKVFLTGSYWNNAVPMVAALKTLEILQRDNVVGHLEHMGQRLRTGLLQLGQAHGIPIKSSGPSAVPFYRIAEENDFKIQQQFCRAMLLAGVFFHPHHNWFLCAAHQAGDIDETLERVDKVLGKLKYSTPPHGYI